MTFLEALKIVLDAGNPSPDNFPPWFRPVAWRGLGWALSIGGNGIFSHYRGTTDWHPDPRDLLGEWEVVDPDDVMKERRHGKEV